MALIYHKGPNKNLDLAVSYYEKALERRPRSRTAHRGLADIYMTRGDATAISSLEALHELEPEDANVHYNIAAMLHFLGRSEEALQWIENGLELTKGHADDTKAFEVLRLKVLSGSL